MKKKQNKRQHQKETVGMMTVSFLDFHIACAFPYVTVKATILELLPTLAGGTAVLGSGATLKELLPSRPPHQQPNDVAPTIRASPPLAWLPGSRCRRRRQS